VYVCSYAEDDNVALLLGLPPDDVSLLQHHNLYYQALPVLLYLVAYAFIFLYGYFVQAYIAVVAWILSPVVNRYCLLYSLSQCSSCSVSVEAKLPQMGP